MARERESWQRDDKRDYGSDDLGYTNEDNAETWRSQGRSGNDFHGGGRWRGGQQSRGEQGGQRYGEEFGEGRQGGGREGQYGRYGQGGQYGQYGQQGGQGGFGQSDPYRQGQGYEGGYQGGEHGDWRGGGSQGGWGGGERGYMGSRGGYRSGGHGMGEGGQRGSSSWGGSRGSQDRDFWDRASDEVSSWLGDEEADRRRRKDQHRGKGPRGYTRSDDRIKEDVNDRLTDDWAVDASDIEVDVDNCEVTLTGEVTSREMKRRAEDVAEAVSGVKHVQNNLRIKQAGQSGAATSGGGTGTTTL
jgi:osmotically-inducible protein OsmY